MYTPFVDRIALKKGGGGESGGSFHREQKVIELERAFNVSDMSLVRTRFSCITDKLQDLSHTTPSYMIREFRGYHSTLISRHYY